MLNNILMARGPEVMIDYRETSKLNIDVIGNGADYIKPEDIKKLPKAEFCILNGHGSVWNRKRKENPDIPPCVEISLLVDTDCTARTILLFQELLGTKHFYLASCHAGALPETLQLMKDRFTAGTTITIFSGGKYPLALDHGINMIKKLAYVFEKYKKDFTSKEVDQFFFKEYGLKTPHTIVRCEFTKSEELSDEILFSAFKSRGPKNSQDILNCEEYLNKGKMIRALICEDAKVLEYWRKIVSLHDFSNHLDKYKNQGLMNSIMNAVIYEEDQEDEISKVKSKVESWIASNAKFESFDTHPITLACYGGKRDLVELLIEKSAYFSVSDFKNQEPPLNVAILKDDVEMAELLITKAKANVDQANQDGVTPLHIACANQNVKIVEMLIKAGANVDQANQDGTPPLYIACSNGNVKVVEMLIKAGANVDQGNPLFIACQKKLVEVVKLLIEAGADINQVHDSGKFPISEACVRGSVEIVKLLIQNNVILNSVKGNSFQTPLSIAKDRGFREIAELLNKYEQETVSLECR